MSESKPIPSAPVVAARLAQELTALGHDYALGGAIALGFWGVPRGTIDVDVTLYLPADRPGECLEALSDIGCSFSASATAQSLREHGFCQVAFQGRTVDVFLPIVPFYELARGRRRTVNLSGQSVHIWDAETLAVFKMMFFRPKDVLDITRVIEFQGSSFDHAWVRRQLEEMYGTRDPRLSTWDELVGDATGEKP